MTWFRSLDRAVQHAILLVLCISSLRVLCGRPSAVTAVELTDGTAESGVMHEPEFKADFFSQYKEPWSRIFSDGGFQKDQSYNFLEIGSSEGRSSLWLLENILVHPDSRLTCIDNWQGGPGYSEEVTDGMFERFMKNTAPYHGKMMVYKGASFDALRHDEIQSQRYDFVYINGVQRARNTLEDAVLSFPLLNIGGFMLFDDYLSNIEEPQSIESPKAGVDAFLQIYAKAYRVAGYGYQLCIQKIAD